MTIILRLDPVLPALWRSPDVLQFGTQAVVTLSPVEAWQLRLLHELAAGFPESALMVWADILRVDPARVRGFLSGLAPALLRVDPDVPVRVPRVVLHSPRAAHDARMLAAVRSVCTDAGIDVVEASHAGGVRGAGDTRWARRVAGPHAAHDTASGASAAGTLVPGAETADLAIVLAHHVVDPRTSAALLAAEVTHLPVVMTSSGVRVGPVAVPGQTACLHCAELHNIDRDPSWPTIATQLLELVAPTPTALVAIEAAALTARFVAAATANRTNDPVVWGASVSVRAEGAHREWRRHRPHRSGGCLSLAQNATHPVALVRQNVRTTATAMRVPA